MYYMYLHFKIKFVFLSTGYNQCRKPSYILSCQLKAVKDVCQSIQSKVECDMKCTSQVSASSEKRKIQ